VEHLVKCGKRLCFCKALIFISQYIPTGKNVAIKIVELEDVEEDLEEIQKEIIIMTQVHSPAIIDYYGSCVFRSQLWIVMELLDCGALNNYIEGGIEEQYIAVILHKILEGLQHMHLQGKIHRDVKAGNVLLSSKGDVKLSDFGLTGQIQQLEKRKTKVGSPYWFFVSFIVFRIY
jgi:serine/threonine protein kinase